MKVNKERLAHITNSIYKDLRPHIKSFVSQVTSDYYVDTHFGMPDSVILNCQMVKRDIMWGLAKLPLPPSVNNIIHPTATKAKPPRSDIPGPGGGGEKKDNTKCEYDTHAVSQLKGKNRPFFRKVIQKHGIFPQDVKNPKFDNSHEECAK